MKNFGCLLVFIGLAALCWADERCERCRYTVSMIGNMASQETRDQLYREACESFLEADIDACKTSFQEMSPEEMCDVIGECSVVKKLSYDVEKPLNETGFSSAQRKIMHVYPRLDKCCLCGNFIRIVHFYLIHVHRTVIVNSLKCVCHVYGRFPFLGHNCATLIDVIGVQIIHYIRIVLGPKFCYSLGFCHGNPVPGPRSTCQECEMSMGMVYDVLHDPALSTWIEDYTKDQCFQSTGLAQTCHSFGEEVSKTLRPAVEMLREADFLKNACQVTGICGQE